MESKEPRLLTHVYEFKNGVYMAFDQHEKMFHEYQGKGDKVLKKIKRDYPNINIKKMDWNGQYY